MIVIPPWIVSVQVAARAEDFGLEAPHFAGGSGSCVVTNVVTGDPYCMVGEICRPQVTFSHNEDQYPTDGFDELIVRGERLVIRWIKATSFRDLKTLEDFDWAFTTNFWVTAPRNCIFLSTFPPGPECVRVT